VFTGCCGADRVCPTAKKPATRSPFPDSRCQPANAITGRAYSGINVLLLWIDAAEKGFTSHRWLTFKQALDVGGNVRKGEKSTLVTLFKPFEKKETDEQGKPLFDEKGNAVVSRRNFMTSFHLFNVEQCENLPEKLLTPVSVAGDAVEAPEQHDIERIQRAEKVVACSGVPVVHRHQDRAFYSPGADRITMPDAVQFHRPADYYSTLLHELVHSTGHISRLAREGITSSSRRFGEQILPSEDSKESNNEEYVSTYQRVNTLINEQKLYLNPDLTLNMLARKTGVPARQISKAVNLTRGCNVSQWINGFRIGYTSKAPNDVDNTLVLGWRRHVLKEQKLQATTWNNKVTHMRALFNFGMKTGLLSHDVNPFSKSARWYLQRQNTCDELLYKPMLVISSYLW
jgi:antirestriction protein ArdC